MSPMEWQTGHLFSEVCEMIFLARKQGNENLVVKSGDGWLFNNILHSSMCSEKGKKVCQKEGEKEEESKNWREPKQNKNELHKHLPNPAFATPSKGERKQVPFFKQPIVRCGTSF